MNPIRNSSELLFTQLGGAYDFLTRHDLWREQNARLLAYCPGLSRDARVLDIGAGTGVGTLAIAQRLPATAEVVGVDLTPAMIERARALHRAQPTHGARVRFEVANAAAMPQFGAAHFDAVVANSFLYLVPDPVAVATELHRVMKPGARLVFMEPHRDGSLRSASLEAARHVRSWSRRPRTAARLAMAMVAWRTMSGLAGRRSKGEMHAIFLAAGFKDVKFAPTLGGLGVHVIATKG